MKSIKKICSILMIIITNLIFFAVNWGMMSYDSLSFDEVLYHLEPNVVQSSFSVIKRYLCFGLLPAILCSALVIWILLFLQKKAMNHSLTIKVRVTSKKKTIVVKETKLANLINKIVLFLMSIMLLFSLYRIGLFSYLKYSFDKSEFIENNYVDPKEVDLKFPNEKRNLVYIFVESLESTYFNSDVMVNPEENVMENLKNLTDDNIYFSNTQGYGGAIQVSNLGWTTAGMIAQTAGIPTKIPGSIVNDAVMNNLVPGAYSIGDVLEKEGYNQELMIGSLATFGNREAYFKNHGNYKIFDFDYAKKKNKIPKNYYEWWGFEDSKLFEFAKEEISNLSKSDKPFNFTMLTANTHCPDGYLEASCSSNFKSAYSNALACSTGQILEFVNWLKEQDFYDSTTIIISGDHLTMDAGYLTVSVDSDERTVYNLFINSSVSEGNFRDRKFTTMDLYPTTLAAMGVKIDGNKLGLGVNLFSSESTLVETFGREYVDEEFLKTSVFYKSKILK